MCHEEIFCLRCKTIASGFDVFLWIDVVYDHIRKRQTVKVNDNNNGEDSQRFKVGLNTLIHSFSDVTMTEVMLETFLAFSYPREQIKSVKTLDCAIGKQLVVVMVQDV